MTIDSASYEPAYVQLAGLIRAAIERGELAAGQAIPSEAALVQEHGVSRETARRAVAILRNEGTVVTESGRGSYVRDVAEINVVQVGPSVRVSARMPTVAERSRLRLSEGTPVLVVEGDEGKPSLYPADRTVIEVPAERNTDM